MRPPSGNWCSDVASATGDVEDDAVEDDDGPDAVAAAGCPHGAHHVLFRQPLSSCRCAHAIAARTIAFARDNNPVTIATSAVALGRAANGKQHPRAPAHE